MYERLSIRNTKRWDFHFNEWIFIRDKDNASQNIEEVKKKKKFATNQTTSQITLQTIFQIIFRTTFKSSQSFVKEKKFMKKNKRLLKKFHKNFMIFLKLQSRLFFQQFFTQHQLFFASFSVSKLVRLESMQLRQNTKKKLKKIKTRLHKYMKTAVRYEQL